MKKYIHNNRGFSLVELLIAVAVMAILITPIVTQLVQTVNTSGQAKEKQYVVDNVENVIEQFRSIDLNNGLDAVGDVISDPYLGDVELIYDSAQDTLLTDGKIKCKLVDINGDPIPCFKSEDHTEKVVTDSEVSYNQKVYAINSADDTLGYYLLGKKKTKYAATIVVNDLNNVIAECYVKSGTNKAGSLEIDFSHADGSDPKVSTLVDSKGFERRSDNMIIKSTVTEVDDNISGNARSSGTKTVDVEKITSVVCKVNSGYEDVLDPNSQEVANLQNIDSKTMAIITSDATTFDYEIEKDIAHTLVHYAQANPDTTLGKKANDPEELNKYIKDLITNPYAIQKSRAIYLSITAGTVTSGKPDYYHVRCDVVYRIAFTGSGSNLIKPFGSDYSSSVGTYKYNVLNRDYYTKDPTNVYFVYEPLLLTTKSGNGNRTYYADNDYIYIETDKYTNNVLVSDKPSGKSTEGLKSPTVYLIGSTNNWAKATGTQTNTYIYENYDYHMYRTFFGNEPRDVQIILCNVNSNPESTSTTVYTNIAVATYVDGTFPEPSKRRNRLKQQFVADNNAFSDRPDISKTFAAKYDNSTLTTKVGDEYSYIKPYYSEKTTNVGRLYQITAVLKNNDTKEKTYISGAKGAN